jgi:hypothetical protein
MRARHARCSPARRLRTDSSLHSLSQDNRLQDDSRSHSSSPRSPSSRSVDVAFRPGDEAHHRGTPAGDRGQAAGETQVRRPREDLLERRPAPSNRRTSATSSRSAAASTTTRLLRPGRRDQGRVETATTRIEDGSEIRRARLEFSGEVRTTSTWPRRSTSRRHHELPQRLRGLKERLGRQRARRPVSRSPTASSRITSCEQHPVHGAFADERARPPFNAA